MITLCECGHGKSWHQNGKRDCGWRKKRNSGEHTSKKRCDCIKFRPGEQVETPVERWVKELQRQYRERNNLDI